MFPISRALRRASTLTSVHSFPLTAESSPQSCTLFEWGEGPKNAAAMLSETRGVLPCVVCSICDTMEDVSRLSVRGEMLSLAFPGYSFSRLQLFSRSHCREPPVLEIAYATRAVSTPVPSTYPTPRHPLTRGLVLAYAWNALSVEFLYEASPW